MTYSKEKNQSLELRMNKINELEEFSYINAKNTMFTTNDT